MKLIKILIIGLFIILTLPYPSNSYAQQCGGGVTCCSPISGNDPQCLQQGTIPGACDENCNATCPNGGSEIDNNCGWSNATPPPGGGGYNYLSCQTGTKPTGGVIYLPGSNFSCMGGGKCDQWFPSSRDPNSECNKANSADCSVSQLCCAPGQAVECGDIVSANDILPGDTHNIGYYNCPTGTHVAVYEVDEEPRIYCRSGCRCVTPCGTRPGTTRTCSVESFETYSREVMDPNLKTCNIEYYNPTDDDDRWISTTLKRCYDEWQTVIECDDEGENCKQRRRLVRVCIYNLNCIKRATVCRCNQSCSTTAPTNLNFDTANGRITWTAGTGGTSQNLYVSKTQSDVTNNCGSGTNCIVNASLSSSATSHTFSPALDAGTVYYAKVRNYKDASCNASSTVYSFLTPIPDTPWWQVKDGDVTNRPWV